VIEALRTPDDRFDDLVDYDFEPHYLDVDGVRIHYLDEGPRNARPVVLFHGEPTWSFLYRKVIPALTAAGYRSIAPDYPGFGKSDKPVDTAYYTYDRHIGVMESMLASLGVGSATAVVQDWGGPIGIRLAVEHPEWFDRMSILNTGLFSGREPGPGFMQWRSFVERTPDLPIGFIMARSAVTDWPQEAFDGYEAPFPDVSYKVGAHQFPLIVPIAENQPGASKMGEVKAAMAEWTHPTQVLFSTDDPIFSPRVGQRWVDRVPGATTLELIEHAGHFLQEDQGEEVGRRLVDFLQRTD
jgi:haloalkane dehalogenase